MMVVHDDPGEAKKLVGSLHQAQWPENLAKVLDVSAGESFRRRKFSNQFEIGLDDPSRLRPSEENFGYNDVKRIPSPSPWKDPLVRPGPRKYRCSDTVGPGS